MKHTNDSVLAGKVAVITGAASGIGLALALQAARCGMKVALADVEESALKRALERMKEMDADAIGVVTDVADFKSVSALAAQVEDNLGEPWLVVNNAGVAKLGLGWQLTEADWRWVIDVNLYGVVNGVLAFLPGMVARNSGYLVNTSSAGGLLGVPGSAPYVASKHAVLGLSESLYRELRATGTSVGVSVLCPAAVNTNIVFAERNRPGHPHFDAPDVLPDLPFDEPINLLQPEEIAGQVFAAIDENRFWVLPHAEQLRCSVINRVQQALDGINPNNASMDRVSALLYGLFTNVNFIEEEHP